MNKKLLVLLIPILAVLSGCWDENQAEKMLYVNGVGVDFKDGQYEVYAQFVQLSKIANSEKAADETTQAEIGYSKGNTMDEAIHKLYHSVDQKVYWGHFSLLIVSEEALKKSKLNPVIDTFIRFRETRYNIWVYATKDSVKDVLLERPVLNEAITSSKLGNPENTFDQESFIEPINIRKLIIAMDEPGHEVMIPFILVKENWESIDGSIKAPALSGVSVVSPNSYKGTITDDKARGIQWMSNETKRGQITFKSNGGEYFTMVVNKVKVKIEPIVSSGEVTFDINVKLSLTVSTIGENVSIELIKKKIKKEIEKEIMVTYEEALKKDIDIYHFSEKLYRKDVNEWKKHQKDGRIKLTMDSIHNLEVHISKLDSDRKSFKKTIE